MNTDVSRTIVMAAAVLCAVPARAGMIPISGVASVAIEGWAMSGERNGGGGIDYTYTKSLNAPFTAFNGDLSTTISWTIPDDPNAGFTLPRTFSVWSHANQDIAAGSDLLTVSGALSADNSANVGSPYAYAGARAQSTCDLVFHLDGAMSYSLTMNLMAFDSDGFATAPNLSLAALNGSLLLQPTFLNPYPSSFRTWSYASAGILPSGDYHLIFTNLSSIFNDPIGMHDSKNFGLQLEVASIPDTAPTISLLLLGIAGLAALRLGRRCADILRTDRDLGVGLRV